VSGKLSAPITGQGCQRLCQPEEAKSAKIVSANQRSRLHGIVSPISGQGFQRYCSPIRGQCYTGLCHQSDAKTVRETVRQSEPRLPKKVSARRAQDCQYCVRQLEVKAARDCVTNQKLSLPGILSAPIRGQGCQRLRQPEEAKAVRIVFANQRSMLRGVGLTFRCFDC
jgi:hypothetical protein